MKKRYQLWGLTLAGAFLVTIANGAARAEQAPPVDAQISVQPYVWAIGTNGTVGPGEHPDLEVDMPFHDILENLNFYLAGRIEARKDKWLLYGDGLAATLDVKGGASTDFGPFTLGPVTVGPFDVGPPRLGKTIGPFTFGRVIGPFTETLDYDVKLKLKLAEMGIAYRLGQWSIGESTKHWSVDALVGGRFTDLEIKLSLSERSARALGVSGSQSVTLTEKWIDPFVGLRLGVDLAPKWDLVVSADIGGFGLGSDSTWNAWAMVNYQWSDNKRLSFGYRGLHQDYQDGSGAQRFKWDETLFGPVAAFAFRF